MTERKKYDPKLVAVGKLFQEKRKKLGINYSSREKFILFKNEELFKDDNWISPRYLANIELGKNWISIEKFISLSQALEIDPVSLFAEVIQIYFNEKN